MSAPDGFVRCPFCASTFASMEWRQLKAKHYKDGILTKYWVRCTECLAQGPVFFDRVRAHTAWNERSYGDVNTLPEWAHEERNGGPQVAEWAERQKAERDSGEAA